MPAAAVLALGLGSALLLLRPAEPPAGGAVLFTSAVGSPVGSGGLLWLRAGTQRSGRLCWLAVTYLGSGGLLALHGSSPARFDARSGLYLPTDDGPAVALLAAYVFAAGTHLAARSTRYEVRRRLGAL